MNLTPLKVLLLKEYLNAIGVDEYNPVEIIRKTKGKMAEDQSWLEVTEL